MSPLALHRIPRGVAAALPWLTALLVLLFSVPAASALPPGGASPNTPGTSSSVSPSTVRAGDTLSFKLSGFPANEQVYVKIDNGDACPSDAAQGACVVHQQKSDGNGSVSGSFVLPKDLAEGRHTLRFLSTELVEGKGSKGYSNQSPEFTVEGVNQNSSGGQRYNVSAKQINGGSSNSGGSNSGSGSNGRGSQGGSNSGSGDSGSNNGGEVGGSADGGVEYVDENGNPISKEEYDRLMAEGGEEEVVVEEEEESSEDEQKEEKSTASASASQASEDKGSDSDDNAQAASASSESGSGFPWVGAIALVLMAAIAAMVLIRRRRNATEAE